jgi:hypothetical protein
MNEKRVPDYPVAIVSVLLGTVMAFLIVLLFA